MAEDDGYSKVLSFELGDGTRWRLIGWKAIERWHEALQDAWAWVRNGSFRADPVNMQGHLVTQLNELRNLIVNAKANGQAPSELNAEIPRILNHPFGPPHADSEAGITVANILSAAGPDAALFALAFNRGTASYGHLSTLDQFRGAIMVAYPALAAQHLPVEHLAEERARFRRAARDLTMEIQEGERQRGIDWEATLKLSGEAATTWSQRRARRWLRYTLLWRKQNHASLESIRAVETFYREAMSLKAPVEYWTTKAAGHRTAESHARGRLLVYFPAALLLIVLMFAGAAVYLLSLPEAKMPPGLYFIASAGLASAAGILFWAGRLLTKLYLSEHHLRHDAEERATMTTTYLALTADQAAADVDRHIVLNALFRSTSDGIVKEEGGLDPSLAAALGKFLAR